MLLARSAPEPIHLAFLGCGFITSVHSQHLAKLSDRFVCSYASREVGRAEQFRNRFRGLHAYDGYSAALSDPSVDAVVVAVPPSLHCSLALEALRAGKHVLVEKPAFPRRCEYDAVRAAREESGRVVLVGENDHYKPLAVTLRKLLAEGVIGELVLAQFTTVAHRPKPAEDWRNDETMAGGDAFFEEGIHWLHLAGSIGPRITRIGGFRPAAESAAGTGDRRRKSMLVAFEYAGGAVGALYYSREIPSALRGLRWSKLYGRKGVITFESNGGVVVAPGRRLPRVVPPGLDIRGYRAMYQDFARSIREGTDPQMSLETALADHALMEQVYDQVGKGDR